jgi:hypothetical protein
MKNYTAAGGGVEGAAAVEAANKLRQEGELKLDDDEEEDEEEDEIDMLQDDQDDEVKLPPTLASPVSVNTDHSMPSQ